MNKIEYLNAQITTQAVIKNSKNEILLLKRGKPGGWFTLPGGTIHRDEDVKDGLKRELIEETGLKINIGKPLWVWQSDHIGKDLLGIVFDTVGKIDDNAPIKLSPEHNKFGWFSINMLFKDEKVDPYIKKEELKELLKTKLEK